MDIIHQGECGQDAKWSLTSENTLIISGEGRMKDYEIRSSYNDFGGEPFMNVINDDYLVPWRDYSNDITQIIIEEGITYIGSFAFCNFQSLESVILPHSLSEIGICSFAVCQNLYDIELNPQVKIAEWAFFGSPFVVTENEDTPIEISPKILEELRERLAPKMEDYLNRIKKSSSHQNSDSPFIEDKYDIYISHLGIDGHITEVDSDGTRMCYGENPIPNDMTKQQISESWKGHFFYEKAEDYFQGLFLDSYNKSKQLATEEENNLVDIDNYYLSLLIKNAIIKYQYAQNTIKLLNEVTEEDITDYAERRKKELSLIASGIIEPPKSSIAFRLGRLYEYLENVLDRNKTLGALGFDNVEQVSNWLSSGIDSIDGDIVCSDKITLNNLVKAYLDCQKRILYENDRTIIAMWYLISNCKLTNHDYKSVDESYIGELKIKHQWLVNNLSFDILYRMMYPPEYGCTLDGWFNNVEVYLRKDVIDDYPLSSLYVEDELLRGANIYINELLKRDGLGPYLYHEIYNDNKKNEILKYIGLSVEYEEGAQMVKGVDEGNKNAVGLEILNFKLKEPLNESELEKLYTSLVEEKFVSRESRIEDLSHVLGRPRPNDYKRIGWIKRNKNKTISKKSVLTFLRCLEVDWDDIEPKKLNYCFDTGKVPFKDNNLKDDKSFNCDKGKNANSEAVDDLYEVMSMVFGEDSERYKRIIKIPLIQNIL